MTVVFVPRQEKLGLSLYYDRRIILMIKLLYISFSKLPFTTYS